MHVRERRKIEGEERNLNVQLLCSSHKFVLLFQTVIYNIKKKKMVSLYTQKRLYMYTYDSRSFLLGYICIYTYVVLSFFVAFIYLSM